jgi:hypothetical protein
MNKSKSQSNIQSERYIESKQFKTLREILLKNDYHILHSFKEQTINNEALMHSIWFNYTNSSAPMIHVTDRGASGVEYFIQTKKLQWDEIEEEINELSKRANNLNVEV